jgi:hypothetical protein
MLHKNLYTSENLPTFSLIFSPGTNVKKIIAKREEQQQKTPTSKAGEECEPMLAPNSSTMKPLLGPS